MIVVSDTSAISGLFLVGQAELLPAIFRQVVVPQKVMQELLVLETDFKHDLSLLKTADWLCVEDVSDKALVASLQTFLDDGESEAIVLAKEIHADYLLMDEMEGRTVATEMGLKTIGVLGILTRAKNAGLIPLVRPVMDDLRSKARFFISEKLYRKVLKETGE